MWRQATALLGQGKTRATESVAACHLFCDLITATDAWSFRCTQSLPKLELRLNTDNCAQMILVMRQLEPKQYYRKKTRTVPLKTPRKLRFLVCRNMLRGSAKVKKLHSLKWPLNTVWNHLYTVNNWNTRALISCIIWEYTELKQTTTIKTEQRDLWCHNTVSP